MRRGWLACLGVAAVGCPAHSDVTPPIHVTPAAAGRWTSWQRRSGGESGAGSASPARVHALRPGDELGGPNAIGRPGDLILENDEVVFVVDQLGPGTGFAESGGNVVDAADAHVRKDELGQLFTYFGVFPRQALYDALSSGVSDDGVAWALAQGRELYEPKLQITTRYTLKPGDRALRIETTLENAGEAAVELASVGDAIQWGGAEKIAPGKPRGFRGASQGAYVGGVGRFTSYAVFSAEGPIEGTSGGSWTDTSVRSTASPVRLAPHEKAGYARFLGVGERADTSSVAAVRAMTMHGAVGGLNVTVRGDARLPSGTTLSLAMDGADEKLTLAPPFTGRVPAGRYWVSGPGREPGAAVGPVDVAAGASASAEVTAEPAAALELTCSEREVQTGLSPGAARALPCKLTLQGLDATGDPDFGPANMAGPARNQATTGDGSIQLAVAAGRYRITASRGPEYTLASADVDLRPGETQSRAFVLARVVDTRGYLACDFHQHSMASADAPVSMRDRVVSNAAEGVEVAVATEHNLIADLEPVVRALHLERELVEVSGDELTTDASRHPWGHANVYPLPFDPARPRGGAPPVRDRDPGELFALLRSQAGRDVVVQVNHPRSGRTGYFDLLGFDRTRGAGTDPAYEAAFDAMEVWSGRNVKARAGVVDDWRALLRSGHAVTPMANTDTHGVVGQEAGYPRTYVGVADDGHLDAWSEERASDWVRGVKVRRDVVLTNGPILRISANGGSIGSTARGHEVALSVHVECAPWVSVETVRVIRASEGPPARGDERAVHLLPLPSGARGADLRFALHFDADDAFFVVAEGKDPLAPVVAALAGEAQDILPWAMTGAVWVDADGGGLALGTGPRPGAH